MRLYWILAVSYQNEIFDYIREKKNADYINFDSFAGFDEIGLLQITKMKTLMRRSDYIICVLQNGRSNLLADYVNCILHLLVGKCRLSDYVIYLFFLIKKCWVGLNNHINAELNGWGGS